MQQTQKYALNLIERSDVFSPDPLNENMEKVEAALGTMADSAAHAALDLRVQALEARRIVYGTYTGSEAERTVLLGFTPSWLYIQNSVTTGSSATVTPDVPYKSTQLRVVSGGFCLSSGSDFNKANYRFHYLAIV